MAEQALGVPRVQAEHKAVAAFCASRADAAAHQAALAPFATVDGDPGTVRKASDTACLARYARAGDVTTTAPRYQAIFSSRPGYPVLAAPFISAFGILHGLRLLGLLTAAACSLLLYRLLRSNRFPPLAAAAGQAALLASPLGWWSIQPLGEGLVLAGALGALWGATVLLRRSGGRVSGALLLLASLAALTYTRYSIVLVFVPVAIAVTLAAVLFHRPLRHYGTALFLGLSAVGTAAVAVGVQLLGLPSAKVTLQDTFTNHFALPDVSDPWHRLVELNLRYWRDWIAVQASEPFFLLATGVALWALFRRTPGLGWLALGTAVAGAAQVAAHPLAAEAERLGVLMWVPAVLGVPVAVELLLDRSGLRPGRSVPPAPEPGATDADTAANAANRLAGQASA
jgi:hypothetical protein